jgi:hypothetical protein
VPQQPKLVEGIDYYMEGDSMVFTQRFLLKRGYCCNSGCRHCPYGSDAKPTVGVSIVGLGDSDDE